MGFLYTMTTNPKKGGGIAATIGPVSILPQLDEQPVPLVNEPFPKPSMISDSSLLDSSWSTSQSRVAKWAHPPPYQPHCQPLLLKMLERNR